jgi:hypothetical protein
MKVTADTYVSEETKAHPSVRECGGTCGRWTRATSQRAQDFPGTVVRNEGDLCEKCKNALNLVSQSAQEKAAERHAQNISTLNGYLAGRASRLART